MKMAIIVRKDLKMPKGKACAQVAHAAVECVLKSNKELIKEWISEGQKKVVLKVENEKELLEIFNKAKSKGLTCSLIRDAGRTVLKPGTLTCCGIGPDKDNILDQITSNLGMY